MNLVLKTIFLIAVLLLLVIMGMHNQQSVSLSLPPTIPNLQKVPAALMYFGFFAVGFLSGSILTGGRKGGGKSAK